MQACLIIFRLTLFEAICALFFLANSTNPPTLQEMKDI